MAAVTLMVIVVSLCKVLAILEMLACFWRALFKWFAAGHSGLLAQQQPQSSDSMSSSFYVDGSARVQPFDVFVSYRSPDSSKTLVDFLRQIFKLKGLSSFVDFTNMDGGQDAWPAVSHAIRNSSVHVVVLSPDFAHSKWCLEEVFEIMQLPSSSEALHVLPVFYHVKPTDMRFPKPGAPFGLTTIKPASLADRERWSNALYQLSLLKGYRLDDTNGFGGKLASNVVDRVVELLHQQSQPLHVDPIWVDHYSTLLEYAETCLDLSSANSNEKIVSIGVTGPSKLVIAKMLFNKLQAWFSASCILLNVREQAKPHGGLLNLQSKLLKDLAKVDKKIQHIDEGIVLLLGHLQIIKCFIVLDDIDLDMEQLRSLLVLNKHQLGQGSRLVFTSGYRHVLESWASVDKTLTL